MVALIVLVITFGSLVAPGCRCSPRSSASASAITGDHHPDRVRRRSARPPRPWPACSGSPSASTTRCSSCRATGTRWCTGTRARGGRRDRAIGTAGSAVIFAGLTVIIALAGLSARRHLVPDRDGSGRRRHRRGRRPDRAHPAAGAARLRRQAGGLRAQPPCLKDRDPEGSDAGRTNGRRWVELVARFRVPSPASCGLLVAVVLVDPGRLACSSPCPTTAPQPASQPARQAYDLISENFGAGTNGPLLVVVVDTQGASDPSRRGRRRRPDRCSGIATDVAAVVPPVADPSDPRRRRRTRPSSTARQYATITVIPKSGPSDAGDPGPGRRPCATDLETLHAETGATPYWSPARPPSASTSPRGWPTRSRSTWSWSSGLAFLLLLLVFRSILVPLKATARASCSRSASRSARPSRSSSGAGCRPDRAST